MLEMPDRPSLPQQGLRSFRHWRVERPFLIVSGLAVVLLALSGTSGALVGQVAPDTPGYLASAVSDNPWGEARHPLYGTLAIFFGTTADSAGHIVLLQALLHVVAALSLYGGARLAGLLPTTAALLSASALLAQSTLFHLRLLLPEAPSIDFLLLAFSGVLAASSARRLFWLLLIPIMLAGALTYLLRPASLPAIIVLPILYFIFAGRSGQRRRLLQALTLFIAVASPFLLQAGIRLRAVDDFNVVSFGGFQMSALAGLMLTPETVERLPAGVRATGQAILAARNAAEAEGQVAPTPRNSSGERSFRSAALGYFDIYARTYDELLAVILKLRKPGESWVAFNRRLTAFSFAAVVTSPLRWVAWIGGAMTRLVGRCLITNAVTLAALFALCAAGLMATWRRTSFGPSAADFPPVVVIAVAWLAATAPLVVVITFPAWRYIDTAGVLLPAAPAVLAAAMIEALRSRSGARPGFFDPRGQSQEMRPHQEKQSEAQSDQNGRHANELTTQR